MAEKQPKKRTNFKTNGIIEYRSTREGAEYLAHRLKRIGLFLVTIKPEKNIYAVYIKPSETGQQLANNTLLNIIRMELM